MILPTKELQISDFPSQIFYLENIDLGPLNLPHVVFPRIKAFDCSVLGRMIQADTNKVSACFGCSKVNYSMVTYNNIATF